MSCNFLRNAYRQIFPVHTDPIEQTMEMAPVLQMGRIDIPGAVEEEFNDWYNTVYIPTYLTVPGSCAPAALPRSKVSRNT